MNRDYLICPGCSARLRRPQDLILAMTLRCARCQKVFAVKDALPPVDTRLQADRDGPPAEESAAQALETLERETRQNPLAMQPRFGPHWVGHMDPWFTVARHFSVEMVGAATYLFVVGVPLVAALVWIVTFPHLAGFPRGSLSASDRQTCALVRDLAFMPACYFLFQCYLLGVLAVALRLLRNRRWAFGTYFLGWQRPDLVLGDALIFEAFRLLVVLPWHLPTLAEWYTGRPADWQLRDFAVSYTLYSGLLVGGWLYLQTRWFFALPLVLDQGISLAEARRRSAAMTQGHLLFLGFATLVLTSMLLLSLAVCAPTLLVMGTYVALMRGASYLQAIYPLEALPDDEDHD